MYKIHTVSVLHVKHTYCPSQSLSVNVSQRNSLPSWLIQSPAVRRRVNGLLTAELRDYSCVSRKSRGQLPSDRASYPRRTIVLATLLIKHNTRITTIFVVRDIRAKDINKRREQSTDSKG